MFNIMKYVCTYLSIVFWKKEGHIKYMSCHRDGGRSQGDIGHSMPPARRRGGF